MDNKVYIIMTLNGFAEPKRVIKAPIFSTRERAEEYMKDECIKEYCWIAEQEVKEW